MRKANKVDLPDTTQDNPTSKSTGRIVPLRSETTLSRFPLHQLAKKGTIKIRRTKKAEGSKTVTTWEVRNPPGPRAYKLDSLVINRRIDEMRNRGEIPKLVKLGSLRSICKELGLAASGKNFRDIQEALLENVGAVITTNLEYIGSDGTKRTFRFSDTRYGAILTGEDLPNGQKADAIYVYLHDIFLSLLQCSQTRPLDYEYLRELPPASQRIYELISFYMFGSLRHGRDCALYVYSELCADAPLTRHYEWNRVRPQMWKIHQPHIKSGYLQAVDFEETSDTDGRPDWIIRYTPGEKAKREYREFTQKRKEAPAERPAPPRLVSAPASPVLPAPPGPDPVGEEDHAGLVVRLMAEGFLQTDALELVAKDPEQCRRQLDALPFRKIDENRAGFLFRAITKGYTMPAAIEEAKKAEARKADAEKAQACPFCKDSYAAGRRLVISATNPRGAMKDCTHDPAVESAFTSPS